MGSKPSKPKLSDQYDLGELQSTYKGWLEEAEGTQRKEMTKAQSRMAASGLKPGSELWVQNMEAINKRYKDQIGKIEQSATKKLIDDIIAEQERFKQQAAATERQQAISRETGYYAGDVSREPEKFITPKGVVSKSQLTPQQRDPNVRRVELANMGYASKPSGSEWAEMQEAANRIKNMSPKEYALYQGI